MRVSGSRPSSSSRLGELNTALLKVILRNSRTPEMNEADLFAIVAACRTGAERVCDVCDRFGVDTYLAACDAMLARTREAMRTIIATYIPEEPITFSDVVDDDGQGNGPFRMTLTVRREGEARDLRLDGIRRAGAGTHQSSDA